MLGTLTIATSNRGKFEGKLPVPGACSVVRHDGLLGARYLTGIDAPQSALRTP